LAVEGAEQPRQVTAEDVVRRFDEILAALREQLSAPQVSIGAIQAVEALGQTIRSEAEAIEFTSLDALGRPGPALRVDAEYMGRVRRVRESRRPTQANLETLEGPLTALGIVRTRLQLSLDSNQGRVPGTCPALFQPSLVNFLGRRVRLKGQVERRGRHIRSLQVVAVEALEEEP
jgi:hypothetical protein